MSIDENTLSESERAFFETGELSPDLAAFLNPPQEQSTSEQSVANEQAQEQQQSSQGTHQNQAQDQSLLNSIASTNNRYAALEQQLSELTSKLTSLTAPAEPDPSIDPIGAITNKLTALHKEITDLRQSSIQTTQQQAYNSFISNVQQLRSEFAKTTTDFQDAYSHLRSVRSQDFRDLGYSEVDIPNILLHEETTLAQRAISNGQNPAKVMYDLAKRHGYTGKQQINPTAVSTAENKIEQLKAGAESSRMLNRSQPDQPMRIESLKEASADQLNKLVTDDDLWNKLVGGRAYGKSIF